MRRSALDGMNVISIYMLSKLVWDRRCNNMKKKILPAEIQAERNRNVVVERRSIYFIHWYRFYWNRFVYCGPYTEIELSAYLWEFAVELKLNHFSDNLRTVTVQFYLKFL